MWAGVSAGKKIKLKIKYPASWIIFLIKLSTAAARNKFCREFFDADYVKADAT